MLKCSLCGDYYAENRSETEFYLYSGGYNYDFFKKRQICSDCALRAVKKLMEKAEFAVCGDCGRRFNFAKHKKLFEMRGKRVKYDSFCDEKVRCYPCMVKWFRTDLDDESSGPDILSAKVARLNHKTSCKHMKRLDPTFRQKHQLVVNLSEVCPFPPVKIKARQKSGEAAGEAKSLDLP